MDTVMYNVHDVALLFGVTEETVRRWIRSGKLTATLNSKKEGYVIFDIDLQRFSIENEAYTDTEYTKLDVEKLVQQYMNNQRQELDKLYEKRKSLLCQLYLVEKEIDKILCR